MRGRAAASHVALHLPGARPPARSLAPGPRLLLLLFSPLQLGLKQPRRKPRGFFFFFEGGCEDSGRLVAGGRRRLKAKDGNTGKVSGNVASPASAPPPSRSPTCQRWLGQEDASDRSVAIPPTLPFARLFHLSASRSFLLRPRSRAWPLLFPHCAEETKWRRQCPRARASILPPSWPPRPRPGRCPRGVRTHCGTLPSPRAAYFPPARAFVCCFGLAHARTCWSTHPLISRASQPAQKGKSPSFTRFTSLFRYIPGF